MSHIKQLKRMAKTGKAATKGRWKNDDPSWMALNDITVWAPDGEQSICNMGGSFVSCSDKAEAQQNFDNGAFVVEAANSRESIDWAIRLAEATQELSNALFMCGGSLDNKRYIQAHRAVDEILAEKIKDEQEDQLGDSQPM